MERGEAFVIGHLVQSGQEWAPALAQSSELFGALVRDDLGAFQAAGCGVAGGLDGPHTVLYWSSDGPGEPGGGPNARCAAKSRSLAQLAVQHSALRVLSFLLAQGANPHEPSCYEFIDASNPNGPTIRAMLDDAAANFRRSAGAGSSDALAGAASAGGARAWWWQASFAGMT